MTVDAHGKAIDVGCIVHTVARPRFAWMRDVPFLVTSLRFGTDTSCIEGFALVDEPVWSSSLKPGEVEVVGSIELPAQGTAGWAKRSNGYVIPSRTLELAHIATTV